MRRFFSYAKKRQGIALIEIVVTIGLITIALFGYFAALKTVILTRTVKHQALAQQVAIKKIEELKALPFVSLPATGAFTDSALSVLSQAQGILTVADYGGSTAIKEITVSITWLESNGSKSVELKTLLTSGGI